MNEPILKKLNEIVDAKSSTTILGTVKFNNKQEVINAFIEFAKFYDHYKHETPEEKLKEGNNPYMPVCAVHNKLFNECMCGI